MWPFRKLFKKAEPAPQWAELAPVKAQITDINRRRRLHKDVRAQQAALRQLTHDALKGRAA